MGVMDSIYQKAKARPARMVFPESDDSKIMEAAYQAGKNGYIVPVLVGKMAAIKSLCATMDLDFSIFVIYDLEDEIVQEELMSSYAVYDYAILKGKSLKRRMSDPLYYALVLTALNKVDAMFAGINHLI